jgi:hypothetical protein
MFHWLLPNEGDQIYKMAKGEQLLAKWHRRLTSLKWTTSIPLLSGQFGAVGVDQSSDGVCFLP